MVEPLITSAAPITLVGGGEATAQDLHKVLRLAPICVAADGGATFALSERKKLAAVIGDFDSISADVLAEIPPGRQHHIAEQDSTDFEKALSRVSAPVVVGVGFLGGRVDHQLAVFHSLLNYAHCPCVLIGQNEVLCLAPPQVALPTEADDIVSLFPLTEVTGRSTGLVWPIDGLQMAPMGRSGTSNSALGPMTLEVDGPGMLLILPRKLMPALVAALAQPDVARWPAPA